MRILYDTPTPLFSLLLIFVLVASAGQHQTIEDDLGQIHILGKPPQRIISLAPNITEVLFALGLDEEIVGVTRFCNYPPKAKTKNRIGGVIDPDLEKIIHLSPDLVIAFRGNPLRVVHRLGDLGLPVFVLDEGTTLDSVFTLIRKIGRITRKENEAESLIVPLQKNLLRVEMRLKNTSERPRVFIDLYGKGLWTFGTKSLLNDLVSRAKGMNIAGEIPRAWFNYSREELIKQDPEYIVIISKTESGFRDTKAWIVEGAHLEGIQAVQKGNIHFLNEDWIARPGPRLFRAFEMLARILHPSLFEEKR